MLLLSPPFSNYINLPKTKSIKGTFTLQPRSGLFLQTLYTLRYDFQNKGWINKIGLRNKGIDWAIKKYKNDKQSIVSIAILEHSEIKKLLNKIPDAMNLELNISCPNTENKLINNDLHLFLNPNRQWCCIKLSPLTNMQLIDNYYNQGFRIFHCSNTLPVKNGGLSGIILKPYTENLIKKIKNKYPDTVIVAGGGIKTINDIYNYKKYKADYYSVSTLLFNPLMFIKFYYTYLKL